MRSLLMSPSPGSPSPQTQDPSASDSSNLQENQSAAGSTDTGLSVRWDSYRAQPKHNPQFILI